MSNKPYSVLYVYSTLVNCVFWGWCFNITWFSYLNMVVSLLIRFSYSGSSIYSGGCERGMLDSIISWLKTSVKSILLDGESQSDSSSDCYAF